MEKPRQESIGDASTVHNETGSRKHSVFDVDFDNLSAAFENPLAGVSREQLFEDVTKFCTDYNMSDKVDLFKRAALVAQNPARASKLSELSPEEKEALEREVTHKWHQPWRLYWLVIMCSLAAAVQGMDETVLYFVR